MDAIVDTGGLADSHRCNGATTLRRVGTAHRKLAWWAVPTLRVLRHAAGGVYMVPI